MDSYEKKYKEALEKAKNMINDLRKGEDILAVSELETMFPELAESEDERIRKALIDGFTVMKESKNCGKTFSNHNIPVVDILAWLEKQGERKSTDDLTQQEAMDIAVAKCFEQGGQKPVIEMKTPEESLGIDSETYNEVVNDCIFGENKPKFNIGDWIVFNGLTLYVNEVVQGYYRTTSIGGIPNSYDWNIDNAARLWTIQDAKPGDVLKEETCTFIIERMKPDGTAIIHCCLFDDGDYDLGSTLGFDVDSTYPATKEQRDLLFQKMKEAGYEWDAEKKELKKISQRTISAEAKEALYDKPSWSEEDIRNIQNIDSILLFCAKDLPEDTCMRLRNWLQSLKPNKDMIEALRTEYEKGRADALSEMKSSWSEEDEVRLQACLDTLQAKSLMGKVDTVMTEWLKSLKDRVQPIHEYSDTEKQEMFLRSQRPHFWRPSDEQIKALEYVAYHLMPDTNYRKEMFSLYEDLKKLK